MRQYEAQGVDHKEAMKRVAKDRGISKRDVYQYLLSLDHHKMKSECIQ